MLGVRGKGFQLAMATLDGGRIGIASQALGIAEGALEETVAYVKERKQFGRPIAAFQNTQFELAEMKARVEAAKYLGLRCRSEEAAGYGRRKGPLQRGGRTGQADRSPHCQRRDPPLPAAVRRLRLHP